MALCFSLCVKTFPLLSAKISFPFPLTPPYRKVAPFHRKLEPKALREWQEYEEAVKRKDLARALRFLKSVEDKKANNNPVELSNSPLLTESKQPRVPEFGLVDGSERDWEVLDTCLNADDLRLVASAYTFLKSRGFLPNFGKYSSIGNFFIEY